MSIKIISTKVIITSMFPALEALPTFQSATLKTVYNKWGFKIRQYVVYQYIVNYHKIPHEYKTNYLQVKVKRWWN